jgi:hypothetical protein
MADPNFFPGFEGDDEAKKQPAAKPTQAPAKPAFDPFADAPPGPAAAPAPAAATGKPQASRVEKPPAAPAPTPSQDDPELKPGSRKDLWKCPHCGAGNKPDRTTCRTCGKSPEEPVVVAWHQNNRIRAGILAAIVLVVVVIVLATRVDLSMREATLAQVDSRPRIGGSAEGTITLPGSMSLEPSKRISICGRVAATAAGPGGTLVVALALGSAARDEKPAATAVAGGFEVDGVVLACHADGSFAPKPGQILSLVGATGVLLKDGRLYDDAHGLIPVAVEDYRVQSSD